MASEWQMPRRGDRCVACARVFEVGQVIHACLYESLEGYQRKDFCLACGPPSYPAALGSWQTCRPEPAARKLQPFDRQAVLAFFRRHDAADSPERIQFRFVLALLLWRKKVLKLADSHRDADGETWRFVMPGTDEAYDVVRPELDEEQIDRLSAQLERLLAGEAGGFQPVADESNSEPVND